MKKSRIFKTTLAVCAMAFAVGGAVALAPVSASAEEPTLSEKVASIQGLNATYDSTYEEAVSGINTSVMPTVRAGGNKYVVFQYDLIEGESATAYGRIEYDFGNTPYGNGLLRVPAYNVDVYSNAEGAMGSGLVFKNSTTEVSPFLTAANEGKTITVVVSRETLAMTMYVTDIGEILMYDNTSGFTISNATGTSVGCASAACYWSTGSAMNSNAVFGTAQTVSKWSTMGGLFVGNGKATMENIKVFDENGNDLGLMLGNDYVVSNLSAPEGYLTTFSSADIGHTAPINSHYQFSANHGVETAFTPLNDTANTVNRTMLYSAGDSVMTETVFPSTYNTSLSTRGQALGLYFANGNYKTQFNFGTKVKISSLESITVRVWSDTMYYGATGAGSIQFFNSKNETVTANVNSVNLNKYLPETVTSESPLTDYVDITIPASDLAVLADEDGYLSGVQVLRVSPGKAGWCVFDEIRVNYDYPVKYDELSHDSVTADNRLANAGETVTLTITNTVKEGYKFDPKVFTENGEELTLTKTGENTYAFTMVEGDVRVSLFQIPVYAINYVLDGGTLNGENPTTWSRESEAVTLVDASKEYYIFAGWYLDADFETPFVDFEESLFEGKETLDVYAKFEKQTYTVTFDSKGGTKIDSITLAWGESILEPTAPTKDYCTFAYWALDGEEYTFGEMPKNNIKLEAVYTTNEYSISATGSEHIQITVEEKATYGATVSVLLNVTDGYELAELVVVANGETIEYFENNGVYSFVMPHDDVTISVTESVIKYRITYVNADGALNQNAIEYSVEKVVSFVDIEKEGYTFEGWYKDEALTEKITSTEGMIGNITVYAKFVEIVVPPAKSGCGSSIAGVMGSITLLCAAMFVFKKKH